MALMAWDVALCVLYGLVATAIILGNGFCLAVIRGVRSMSNPTKVLTASLSVADLCFGAFVVVPVVVALATDGIFDQTANLCTFLAFATILLPRAGIACILAINLDRFVAIYRPMRYREIVTTRRAYLAVGLVWFLSLTLTFLLGFLKGSLTVYHGQFHMCFFTHRSASPDGSSFVPSVVLLVFSVVIPIVVSTVLYVFIVRIAGGHLQRITMGTHHSVEMSTLAGHRKDEPRKEPVREKPGARPNTKAANTFYIVTAGFVIAWLPFLAILLHEGLANTTVPRWLADLSQLAVFSSSWWNVLIFYIRNRSFRKRARKLLHLQN